ncbi:MAG: hypothetical protein IPJ00_01355 [Saprospirales bacterium]|nr:hypothetical protein [Saprospirales bacterium]
MRDFTVAIYRQLLDGLKGAGFSFQTFSDYLKAPLPKTVLLRHDVDDRKLHSLKFAQIQKEKDIVGTYYFRMVPQSYDEGVIREIRDLGHEIGYHYEEMDFAAWPPLRVSACTEVRAPDTTTRTSGNTTATGTTASSANPTSTWTSNRSST